MLKMQWPTFMVVLALSWASVSAFMPSPAQLSIPRPRLTLAHERLLASASSSDDKLSVAIVGGGPAGLAAAVKALGVEQVGSVTVIEKSPRADFSDGPGSWGIGLGPRARKALEDVPGNPMAFLDEVGLGFDGIHNISMVSVNRPWIRESIFNAIEQNFGDSGRFQMEFNTSVVQFDTDQKTLHLKSGSVVDYDFLILADGIRSPSVAQIKDPALVSKKQAYWRVVKPMPSPPLPAGAGFVSFTGKLKSGQGIDAWSMSRKDGSSYLLFFWDHEIGPNPSEFQTADDVRSVMNTFEFDAKLDAKGKEAPLDRLVEDYWASLEDKACEEWIARKPRHFWSSKCKQVVDTRKGIALMGDAAGAPLATLGHGAQRAIVDAVDFAESLEWALGSVGKGGSKEEVVQKTLAKYGAEVLQERRALTNINVFATVTRTLWKDSWKSKLFHKKISTWMEDPSRSYRSIARDPRVFPWLLISKLAWNRRALSEADVHGWRTASSSSLPERADAS